MSRKWEQGIKDDSLVIGDVKVKQINVIMRDSTGQDEVKNMSLIVGWIFDRLFKVKRLIEVNKISSKTQCGETTNMNIKISEDKNCIVFNHGKGKKLLNKKKILE